jgi:hypothetical protein
MAQNAFGLAANQAYESAQNWLGEVEQPDNSIQDEKSFDE